MWMNALWTGPVTTAASTTRAHSHVLAAQGICSMALPTVETPMSAASTMEAVSRSVSTQRAAMNASATLHTSSTGIKKTVWLHAI